MRIVDTRKHSPIANMGRICDQCGHKVVARDADRLSPDAMLGIASALAKFLAIDFRCDEGIDRIDLCGDCAGSFCEAVNPFLKNLRRVTHRREHGDRRMGYRYEMLDENGQILKISALFDESEYLA